MNLKSLDEAPRETRRSLLKRAREIANIDVFGHGHKVDPKTGTPIEQGLGSWENPTQQHIDAYVRANAPPYRHSPEPGYEEHLKKLRARLAEVDAVRRAKAKSEEEDL
jgi:hypothetical protein